MSRSEERLWQRAESYIAQGQATAARITLESLVQRVPDHVLAHLKLGALAYAEDRYRDCARHTLDAAAHLPHDADAICQVALTLLQVGEIVAARQCLDHPAVAVCRSGPTLVRLAGARQMIGEHAEALRLLDRARDAGHDSADFRYIRAIQLLFTGDMAGVEKELDACLRMGTTFGRASVTLARLHKQTPQSNHIESIRAQLARIARGTEDHAAFEFALYKEYEDLGNYEEAWAALARGNAIMSAKLAFKEERERKLTETLIALATPEFLQGSSRSESAPDGPQPIFIVGMPRSGTTVLDRILGGHSQVEPAGELGDFARAMRWGADHKTILAVDETILERAPRLDYAAIGRRYLAQTQWRANGKARYVDKLPVNWIQAGFIRRALPHARILHMVRDPMDVCFSNFRAFFGVGYAYSYSFRSLAAHYRNYHDTLAHWHRAMPGQILDVSYDALADDPQGQARRLLEFCGLDYEPGCVAIENNKKPVATLSSIQIHEGIRKRTAEWRPYERQLAPLRALLDL
ncbi:MAG TPA: sulfotransferase [Rudaea sp.]